MIKMQKIRNTCIFDLSSTDMQSRMDIHRERRVETREGMGFLDLLLVILLS